MADLLKFAVWHAHETPVEIYADDPRTAAVVYAEHDADMMSGDVELIFVRAKDGTLTRWEVAAEVRYVARMLHGEANRG